MLQFFDKSLDPVINPVQDYANGGISGFPIRVDPADYDPAEGFSESIDWTNIGGPTRQNDPVYTTMNLDTGGGSGGFQVFGVNGFAILAFLAGLILIFNWK